MHEAKQSGCDRHRRATYRRARHSPTIRHLLEDGLPPGWAWWRLRHSAALAELIAAGHEEIRPCRLAKL